MSKEISQTEIQREKGIKKKKKNRTSKGTISKSVTYENSEYQKDKKQNRPEVFDIIMAENFAKLMTNTKPQTQEAQRTPSWLNTKITTPKHIIFKLQKTKDKEKIFKDS